MKPLSFDRPRFPPDVIHQAVWLYFRFLVQKLRNKAAALKLLRKLLKNRGCVPEAIATYRLGGIDIRMMASRSRRRPQVKMVGFRDPARSDLEGREHRKRGNLPFAGRQGWKRSCP